jgi:ribosome recycling factor
MSDISTALSDATSKMNKAVEVAKEDFGAIRTGRAHPAMFSKIVVDYYGTMTPLSQLASFQVPEPRMAIVSPFDKGASARKDYIKVARTKAEESRVSIRNIRRTAKEAMEKLEKDGLAGKDDVARGEKDLEKITSDHVVKIDELLKHKEAELLEV